MKHLDSKKFGERVLEERLRKDITQDQLADMIDSTNVVISRIENSERTCSLDYMVRIANALGITANTLLIDSLDITDKTPEEVEVGEILSNCSPEEKAILIRTLEFLKRLLKNYTIK